MRNQGPQGKGLMDQVVVLYTDQPEKLVDFLSSLSLKFVQEQHGTGPVHWACQNGDKVLEVILDQIAFDLCDLEVTQRCSEMIFQTSNRTILQTY